MIPQACKISYSILSVVNLDVYLRIEMGLSTFIKVPTSQQVTDIDDNRPMALPWPFFSVLRRLNQRRPWSGVSLPIRFRCITLALTVLSTSASLISMTALYTWE